MRAFLLSIILVSLLFGFDSLVIPVTFSDSAIIEASDFNDNTDSTENIVNRALDTIDREFIRFTDLTSGDSTLARLQVDSIMQYTYMDSLLVGYLSPDTIADFISTGTITQSSGFSVITDKIRAVDGNGLKLYEDGGNGIFVTDGTANVGINVASPTSKLDISSTSNSQTVLTVKGTGTADLVNILDNTTEVFTILDGGNVGIGTTSPSERLHIVGDIFASNDQGLIKIQGTDISGGAPIATVSFRDQNDAVMGYIGYGSGGNNNLYMFNSIASGDILLNAGSGGVIHPNSDIALDDGKYISTDEIRARDSGGLKLHEDGGTTGIFIQDATANVGINVASPTSKLDISSTSNSQTVLTVKGTGTADLVNIFDNTTEVFTILDGGNVGIGTTSPSYKLDVNGTFRAVGAVTLDNTLDVTGIIEGGYSIISSNGSNFRAYLTYSGDQGILGLDNTSNVQTVKLIADGNSYINGGNVGIGTTTPATTLDVSQPTGDAIIRLSAGHDSGNARVEIQDANSVGSVINMWDASNVKKVVIKTYADSYFNGGNVGIGTTSPSEKLHIVDSDQVKLIIETSGTDKRSVIDMVGDVTSTGELSQLNFKNGTDLVSQISCDITDEVTSSKLTFSTQNVGSFSEKMVITKTGKVGIGTTNPSQTLDVAGNISCDTLIIDSSHLQFMAKVITTDNVATNVFSIVQPDDAIYYLEAMVTAIQLDSNFSYLSYSGKKIASFATIGGSHTLSDSLTLYEKQVNFTAHDYAVWYRNGITCYLKVQGEVDTEIQWRVKINLIKNIK